MKNSKVFERYIASCPEWEKDYQTATQETIKQMMKDSKMLKSFTDSLESYGKTTNKEYLKDLETWMQKLDNILLTWNHSTSEPTFYNSDMSPGHPSFIDAERSENLE